MGQTLTLTDWDAGLGYSLQVILCGVLMLALEEPETTTGGQLINYWMLTSTTEQLSESGEFNQQNNVEDEEWSTGPPLNEGYCPG